MTYDARVEVVEILYWDYGVPLHAAVAFVRKHRLLLRRVGLMDLAAQKIAEVENLR